MSDNKGNLLSSIWIHSCDEEKYCLVWTWYSSLALETANVFHSSLERPWWARGLGFQRIPVLFSVQSPLNVHNIGDFSKPFCWLSRVDEKRFPFHIFHNNKGILLLALTFNFHTLWSRKHVSDGNSSVLCATVISCSVWIAQKSLAMLNYHRSLKINSKEFNTGASG